MYLSCGGVGTGPAWDGGHDVSGVTAPASRWYFTESYTGPGFDEYVCLLNPGDAAASVTFRFRTEGAGEVVRSGASVAAHSRATFRANDLLKPYAGPASLVVESSQPVVAERPMYFDYGGWDGGTCTVGATAAGTAFFFAEGTTRPGFAEYLTLQSPVDDAIAVQASYRFGEGQGEAADRVYEVSARSRVTVFVPAEVGWGQDVSVSLSSSSPFLAERPMYFDDGLDRRLLCDRRRRPRLVFRGGIHRIGIPRVPLPAEPRRLAGARPGRLLHAGGRGATTPDAECAGKPPSHALCECARRRGLPDERKGEGAGGAGHRG